MEMIDPTNNLILGDCLEVMQAIPDNSVDFLCADLPYAKIAKSWDVIIPFDELWPHFYRICKLNAAMVLFGAEPFTSTMILSNEKDFRQKLTWLKTRPTNFANAHKMFMNWTEDIVVFYRQLPTYNPQMWDDGRKPITKIQKARNNTTFGSKKLQAGYVSVYGGKRFPKSVLEFPSCKNNMGEHLHATRKPVELLRYLIRTYSNPGDLVFDPTMGSGTTCIAAALENRKFCGIEKEKQYFDVAVNRVKQIQNNPKLF